MTNNDYIYGIYEELKRLNYMKAINLYYSILSDKFNIGELSAKRFPML